MRLLTWQPALRPFHKGIDHTFPVALHGDEGTGLNEESFNLCVCNLSFYVSVCVRILHCYCSGTQLGLNLGPPRRGKFGGHLLWCRTQGVWQPRSQS